MSDIIVVEGNNELNVQLSPLTSNLYGVVTDAETGKVLSHVWVTLNGEMGRYTGTYIGQFSIYDVEIGYLFRHVPVGSYTLKFEKDLYYSAQGEITLSGLEPRQRLDMQLTPQPPSPELLGEIMQVVIWHEPLSVWKGIYKTALWGEIDERLVEVPANSEIHIGVYWRNLSEVQITAHMDLIVNGQHPEAVRGQDSTVGMYGAGSMQFEPFNLQLGSHSLEVKFSSGGTLLDSWNTTLRATE